MPNLVSSLGSVCKCWSLIEQKQSINTEPRLLHYIVKLISATGYHFLQQELHSARSSN